MQSQLDKDELELYNIIDQKQFIVGELKNDKYGEELKKRLSETIVFLNKLFFNYLGKLENKLKSE